MTAPRRYKLIANPTARRGDARSAISRVMKLLAEKGVPHDLELTAGPKEAGIIAKAACERYDVVVAVGGDGTVNAVVQGMVFSGKPLGVIPCGSGNDFVKSLNIPVRIEDAVDILLRGEERLAAHRGEASSRGGAPPLAGAPFLRCFSATASVARASNCSPGRAAGSLYEHHRPITAKSVVG